jgi:guanylate kinase
MRMMWRITMNKGKLFVITGPSGTGKGTVLKRVFADIDNIFYSISATTRAPRPGEEHGREYYFVSKSDFERMIAENQLLEYAQYSGNYYGTPLKPILEKTDLGRDVVLEIELQGALQVRKHCPDAAFIFIAPPSMEELEQRLRGRGTEDEAHIQMRLAKAKEECAAADKFDHIVVNDDLDTAVKELSQVILSYRK